MANDIDYLKQLQAAMMGQAPEQEIEVPFAPETALEQDMAQNEATNALVEASEQDNAREVAQSLAQDQATPVATEAGINDANQQAKSQTLKTKEEMAPEFNKKKEFQELYSRYKKQLDAPKDEGHWTDHLADMLAGAHNIVNTAQGGVSKNMTIDNAQKIDKARAGERANNMERVKGLMNMLKGGDAANKIYQTKSGLVQLDDQGKPVEVYKDPLADLYGKTREQSMDLRGKKFEEKKTQKVQDDAEKALQSLRKTDSWKDAEKALSSTTEIELLLEDAYNEGGQSLAMIGPRIAKGIAGEVGVLTEQDVTRYVKNPALVDGMMDTMAKIKDGRLTETSYENIKRLLGISKQAAQDKMQGAVSREAILLARREDIPVEDAMYYLDNSYKASEAEKAVTPKKKAKGYSEAQERGIERVMKNNDVSRDAAVKALKKAGKL